MFLGPEYLQDFEITLPKDPILKQRLTYKLIEYVSRILPKESEFIQRSVLIKIKVLSALLIEKKINFNQLAKNYELKKPELILLANAFVVLGTYCGVPHFYIEGGTGLPRTSTFIITDDQKSYVTAYLEDNYWTRALEGERQ